MNNLVSFALHVQSLTCNFIIFQAEAVDQKVCSSQMHLSFQKFLGSQCLRKCVQAIWTKCVGSFRRERKVGLQYNKMKNHM